MESLGLRRKNDKGEALPLVEWLPLVMRQPQNVSFLRYISGVMMTVHFLITGEALPRILP